MAGRLANSGDLDQTPQNAASDLGLHCSPITFLRVSRLKWVKTHVTSAADDILFFFSKKNFQNKIFKKKKKKKKEKKKKKKD